MYKTFVVQSHNMHTQPPRKKQDTLILCAIVVEMDEADKIKFLRLREIN